VAIHAEDRTEAPTPRRRSEARGKGQVARSHDLSAAALLLAGFIALRFFAPTWWQSWQAMLAAAMIPQSPTSLDETLIFVGATGLELARQLGPFLVLLSIVTLGILYVQVGWLLTSQPLIPSLSKINPLNGLMRLFSIRSTMTSLINFAKLVAVGAVAYLTIAQGLRTVLHAPAMDFQGLLLLGASQMFSLGIRLSIVLLVLAVIDYAWQRYRFERELRMTKEEVKDELRSMEGDPAIKRRRRQLQFQMALQRLRREVPKADVVVTNPTHLAVAIQYAMDEMAAPKVVAKGADYLAIRIRQIAAEHGIPLVERKPLARALYEFVDVGQYVPERFYRAVAEILAYVYELRGWSQSMSRRKLVGA